MLRVFLVLVNGVWCGRSAAADDGAAASSCDAQSAFAEDVRVGRFMVSYYYFDKAITFHQDHIKEFVLL